MLTALIRIIPPKTSDASHPMLSESSTIERISTSGLSMLSRKSTSGPRARATRSLHVFNLRMNNHPRTTITDGSLPSAQHRCGHHIPRPHLKFFILPIQKSNFLKYQKCLLSGLSLVQQTSRLGRSILSKGGLIRAISV